MGKKKIKKRLTIERQLEKYYEKEKHATYYNSGNSLAYCPSKDLWRGYYEGSGSISSIKLGWHDIG